MKAQIGGVRSRLVWAKSQNLSQKKKNKKKKPMHKELVECLK
jgi:hypothetical protein